MQIGRVCALFLVLLLLFVLLVSRSINRYIKVSQIVQSVVQEDKSTLSLKSNVVGAKKDILFVLCKQNKTKQFLGSVCIMLAR